MRALVLLLIALAATPVIAAEKRAPAAPVAAPADDGAAPAPADDPEAPAANAPADASAVDPAGASASAPADASAADPAGASASAPADPAAADSRGAPAGSSELPPSAATGAPEPIDEAKQPRPAEKKRVVPTLALLTFDANTGAKDQAEAVAAIVAASLAEDERVKVISAQDIATAIGFERQKQLLSGGACATDECLIELSGAIGARFVVSGRVDRFGSRYVLTATVFDAKKSASLGKPQSEADEEEALPESARLLAAAVLDTPGILAPTPGAATEAAQSGRFYLGLRIGSSFLASLAALSPGGDLELGIQLDPEWTPFVQVGFALLRTGGENEGGLTLLPSLVGIRHYYRTDKVAQPFWGLGLGLQLSFGQYGIFSQSGALPNLMGFGGVRFMVSEKFGLQLEGATNLAQTILGLGNGGLGAGLNLELTGGLSYVF